MSYSSTQEKRPIDETEKRSKQVRLFCLPSGGSGAFVYHSWRAHLAPEIDLCPIQLPGRDGRINEPLPTRVVPLMHSIVAEISPLLNLPFCIFGHSLGALLGFELARGARAHFQVEPLWLGLSGYPAPQLPYARPRIHHLERSEFEIALEQFGVKDETRQNRALMDSIYPVLKADFEMVETYSCWEEEPLICNMSILGGREDPEASLSDLQGWQAQCRRAIKLHMFPGDHDFIERSWLEIAQLVSSEVLGALGNSQA